jgi:hypothetical protein
MLWVKHISIWKSLFKFWMGIRQEKMRILRVKLKKVMWYKREVVFL